MTLPSPGPGRPQHPDLGGKGRTRAEMARLHCTCKTRSDPGCPVHGLRTRRRSHRGFWALIALGLTAIMVGVVVEWASASYPGPECVAALERLEVAGEDPAASAEAEAICTAESEAARAAEVAEEEAKEPHEGPERYPRSHRLPTVTREIAERASRKTLHDVQSWRRAEARELRCAKLNRTRWRCRALWIRGAACQAGRLRVDGVNPHGRSFYIVSGEFVGGWGYITEEGRIRCPFYR